MVTRTCHTTIFDSTRYRRERLTTQLRRVQKLLTTIHKESRYNSMNVVFEVSAQFIIHMDKQFISTSISSVVTSPDSLKELRKGVPPVDKISVLD